MPTGYTADVQDGKVTDFQTFALRCARAFGALIEMRDSSTDEPIPDEFEPAGFYAEKVANAKARLTELLAMTPKQAQVAADQEFEKNTIAARDAKAEKQRQRERYEAMLAKVDAWTPPTSEHQGLKDFMSKQLKESIDFDCDNSFWRKPKHISGREWLNEHIAKTQKDIEYYADEDAKERERAAGRTAWVRALKESLSRYSAMEKAG